MFAREPQLQEQFPGAGGVAQFIDAVRRMPAEVIAQLVNAGFHDGHGDGVPEDDEGAVQGQAGAQARLQHQNSDADANMFEAADEMWQRDYADHDRRPVVEQANVAEGNLNANVNAEASGSGVAASERRSDASANDGSGDVDGGGDGGQGGLADAVCLFNTFFSRTSLCCCVGVCVIAPIHVNTT